MLTNKLTLEKIRPAAVIRARESPPSPRGREFSVHITGNVSLFQPRVVSSTDCEQWPTYVTLGCVSFCMFIYDLELLSLNILGCLFDVVVYVTKYRPLHWRNKQRLSKCVACCNTLTLVSMDIKKNTMLLLDSALHKILYE